ncbi:MAG: hypothetical protein JNK75_01925 [Betaproteobacteria bacterium]|nr:hypothetical protein [Betaproteobacteria bacterium]
MSIQPAPPLPPPAPELMAKVGEAIAAALNGDIRRGLTIALATHAKAREAHDLRAELAALNAASRCHSLNNNALAAMSSAIDALQLADRCADTTAHAHALCAICSAAFSMRLLEEAEPILQRALKEALETGDADLEARARLIHGENLGDLGRAAEAREQLLAAREAAGKTGIEGYVLRMDARLGTLAGKRIRACLAAGDAAGLAIALDDGWTIAADVKPLAEASRNTTLAISMCALQAQVLEQRGDSASAREKFESAIQRAIKIAYLPAVAPWSLQLAAIEMRQGEPDAARATLEAAMRVAEGLRPTFRIAEVCAALAALEQSQGNARAAEQWRLRRDEEQFLFRSEQSRARAVLRAQRGTH